MKSTQMIQEIEKTCQDPETHGSPRAAFSLFGEKWNMSVLFELCRSDKLRFGELKRRIPGITSTMLSASLRSLEQRNILRRADFGSAPPHTEYSLTDRGRALLPMFYELVRWGREYAR